MLASVGFWGSKALLTSVASISQDKRRGGTKVGIKSPLDLSYHIHCMISSDTVMFRNTCLKWRKRKMH